MATGTIKKLVMERGFGFITPDAGGSDIFFHCSALEPKSEFDGLTEGKKVTFTESDGKDGRSKAGDVAVLG